jgi:hypothetical protein
MASPPTGTLIAIDVDRVTAWSAIELRSAGWQGEER